MTTVATVWRVKWEEQSEGTNPGWRDEVWASGGDSEDGEKWMDSIY